MRMLLLILLVAATGETPGGSTLHVRLVSSDPAAGDTVEAAPGRIRLVFSEAVDPEASRVGLVGRDGTVEALPLRRGDGDPQVLVATLPALDPGGHRIVWRTVSRDGHPVEGDLVFVVAGRSARGGAAGGVDAAGAEAGRADARGTGAGGGDAPPPGPRAPPEAPPAPDEPFGSPGAGLALLLLPWVRGIAVGCLLFAAGALALRVEEGGRSAAADRAIRMLVAALPILLAATAALWVLRAGGDPLQALSGSPAGRLEAGRAALALLVAGALLLARRPVLTLVLLAAAIVATAFTGHALTTAPALTVPLRLLHLAAVALWAGGLLLLAIPDPEGHPGRAHRVSGVALAAVVVLGLTGSGLALDLLPDAGSLLGSAYGRMVLGKATGLLVLVGFGYVNRTRLLPEEGREGGPELRRAVRAEIAVVILVLLLAGWLAQTPPPPP